MSRHRRLLSIIGLVILGIILALSFRAYLFPSMLVEFINMTLCT